MAITDTLSAGGRRVGRFLTRMERGVFKYWREFSFWQKLTWILFIIIAPVLIILILGVLIGIAVIALAVLLVGGVLYYIFFGGPRPSVSRSGGEEGGGGGASEVEVIPPPPVPLSPSQRKHLKHIEKD